MKLVGTRKFMAGRRQAVVVLAALLALAAVPPTAAAHGPIAPISSSYLAKPAQVPAGLEAKTVDGDQRMWLRVPAAQTVVVLDYRGAPYLRFSPAGVEVNHNSEMYYLNQTPVAETPPANLTASTPPNWHRVSGGHEYGWHDGRLHALATVALTPGSAFVGAVDDPGPHQRSHECDRRRPVSRRQPVDRVVLADHRVARLRARRVADR